MKQKLYALDAFFIEKLKLSENDPSEEMTNEQEANLHILSNNEDVWSSIQQSWSVLEVLNVALVTNSARVGDADRILKW